jgi:hypothetical protein
LLPALAVSVITGNLLPMPLTPPLWLPRLAVLVFVPTLFALDPNGRPAVEPGSGRSKLVSPGPDGRLRYEPYTARGDTIPDFSDCGYAGGNRPIPEAPVRETLEPGPAGTDDSPRIQAALDRVAALPLDASGLRGVVLLKRGAYTCHATLLIRASGVVLRGEGEGEAGGTVITAAMRKAGPLVMIGGAGGPKEIDGSSREITDDYVPVGARSFTVANIAGYAVGQTVFVVRRGNAAWITEIGMDRITPRASDPKSTRQWQPFDLKFDRVITAIEGHRITVDAPLTCALDRQWGGGALVRYDDPGRIAHCGVEHLRAVSVYDPAETAAYQGRTGPVDEDHADYLVRFDHVKNAWARGLTTVHFAHGPAYMDDTSKWITVDNCRALAPVSVITGGRRYPYCILGQLVLVSNSFSSEARHAFVFGARVPGPNVFFNCRSEKDHATSEPHHRWSVGGLYDNVDARLAIQDRQWMGSGHGWSGANYVVWNSQGELVCQQPPTAQNFAIGFTGKKVPGAFERPDGWWESPGVRVEPGSLFLAQRKDRLGK